VAAPTAGSVRPARPEDAEAVQRVARETWKDTYTGLIPDEVQEHFLAQAYDLERLRRQMKPDHPAVFYVAEADGRVVGFAQLGPGAGEEAELFRIYVLPAYQRLGLGSRLLAATIAEWRRRSRSRAFQLLVRVEQGNTRGIAFYEKHGFRFVAQQEHRLGEYLHTELLYRLEVPAEGG